MAQSATVASEPHVPGPGFRRPAPKKVAIRLAHAGAAPVVASWAGGAAEVSLIVRPLRLRLRSELVFGVFYRRGNHVLSAGPFAQIDGAASLTAEREVRVGTLDRLLANRAAQFDGAFCHDSRVNQNSYFGTRLLVGYFAGLRLKKEGARGAQEPAREPSPPGRNRGLP